MSTVKKSAVALESEASVFSAIAQRVTQLVGIQLGEKQESLVRSRLTKRMRELGGLTPQQYYIYLQDNEETELKSIISLLTTHHSFFFRETVHFDYLKKNLEAIVSQVKNSGRNCLDIWSAACSRGQEVYTLAMFLEYHLPSIDPTMSFKILGSDICEESVGIAKNGVYRWDDLKSVPNVYIGHHWMRGSGDIKDYVKAKESLKKSTEFRVLNLQDFNKDLRTRKFDMIFCRNVFIYFTPQQIEQISNNFAKHLNQTGSVVLGVSESLLDLNVPFKHIGHSIYSLGGAPIAKAEKSQPMERPTLASTSEPGPLHIVKTKATPLSSTAPSSTPATSVFEKKAGDIRVLCVDDSPTVLSILKKIFSYPGYKVVGTAKNGLEAAEFLKGNDVDVLTLDIHMPEQNGVDYLRANFGKGHPPVVVVSSVSREDSDLAMQVLSLGAFDYVEKPSFENLSLLADEVRNKVNCAHQLGGDMDIPLANHNLSMEFAKSPLIQNTDHKVRVLVGSMSDKKKIINILKQFKAPQPPTMLVLNNGEAVFDAFKKDLVGVGVKAELFESLTGNPLSNRVYVTNLEKLKEINLASKQKTASLMILGDLPQHHISELMSFKKSTFVVEDLGVDFSPTHSSLCRLAKMVVPYTSFAYESDKLLAEGDE